MTTKLERLADDKFKIVDEDNHVLKVTVRIPGEGWGIFDETGKRLGAEIFADPRLVRDFYHEMI
jgi:hypothetical protein